MKKRTNGIYSYKKDIGKIRLTNEDECKILANSYGDILMILADGMGGNQKGDYASYQTIASLSEEFRAKDHFINIYFAYQWLVSRIKKVNSKIFNLQDKDSSYKGMGTTLVCAFIVKDKILVLCCGDSRCYIMKNKKLVQLTEDQTYANYLFNAGKIDEKTLKTTPNRHIITNALGTLPSASFDKKIYKYNGETILLCSDGLYNNVNNPDIENILNTNDSPEEKVSSLINLANFNGGSDNISLCLWESVNE